MGARRQTDPHPLGQHEMNQQAISRVITDADSCMSLDVPLVQFNIVELIATTIFFFFSSHLLN